MLKPEFEPTEKYHCIALGFEKCVIEKCPECGGSGILKCSYKNADGKKCVTNLNCNHCFGKGGITKEVRLFKYYDKYHTDNVSFYIGEDDSDNALTIGDHLWYCCFRTKEEAEKAIKALNKVIDFMNPQD